MTPKLLRAVKEPYRVLEQDQRTMDIQRKQLVRKTTFNSVVLTSRPADVLPMSSESSFAVVTKDHILKEISWLFHGILNYYFNDESQPEFSLDWGPANAAT